MAQMIDAMKATVEAEKTSCWPSFRKRRGRGYPRFARRSRPANRSSRDLPDRAPPDRPASFKSSGMQLTGRTVA
jgi:hypothetical protein